MSTKISNLTERLKIDLDGEEFFPIVDTQSGINQTFRLSLKEIFNTGGAEKVTGLSVTQGKDFDDDTDSSTDDGNKFFTLQYVDESSITHTIKIQKYKIEDNDVAFSHIHPDGYITSSEKIEDNLIDNQLTTPKAVDDHVTHRENLLFTNTDSLVKTYFGDEVEGISTFVDEGGNTVLRTPADSEYTRTGSHVLQHFRLNTEVAQDFVNLLAGVQPELDTFKKIEDKFATIDYSDKIGTSQVNLNQFRIDDSGGEPLFPNRLNIKELSINAGLISANAITTDKIISAAVTGSKIAPAAVSNDQIVNLTISEDKIVNATLSHIKLSSGSPEWNTTTVNIPNNLLVNNSAVVSGNITINGTILGIYNAASRGTGLTHQGRALVHEEGDRLSINHQSDYTGGVNIRGVVTVPDMSPANILSGGDQAVVTKAYVDAADVLLNPIAEDKIQDDAIINRHISEGAVNTLEIADDSITTFKIENVGPQWDQTGKVQVSGDLAVAGTNVTIGDPSSGVDKSEIILRGPQTSGNLQRGFASISRNSGSTADLSFKNVDGDITFSSLASAEVNFRLTSTRAFIPKTLTVSGTGSTLIDGTDFTNPALLIGTASDGIAIDNREIVQKGGNLNLGVTNSDQDINFRSGSNTVTTIDDGGNITTEGDFISTTGNFKNVQEVGALTLDTDGAKIVLHTLGNPLGSANAFYNATEHHFFNRAGTQEILKIDSTNRKVTLFTQGTAADHLINKGYVDTKKIAPSDLTNGGPDWYSDGKVETKNSLYVNSTSATGLEIDGVGLHSRNVYGQRGDSSGDDLTYLRLKGSINALSAQITINSNEHVNNQNDIEIRGNTTQFRSGTRTASPISLDIQQDGKIVAPQQSISRIITNNRALTTKEYVDAEIGKTFPDDNYIKKTGNINQSMTAALTIAGTVDPGADERSSSTYAKDGTNLLLKGSSEAVSGIFFESEKNGTNINHPSDFGYIQYHAHGYGNTTGEQSDLVIGVTNDSVGTIHTDKVVIDVPGINNFVLTPDDGTTEHKIWHAGNHGSGSGLDADLLDGQTGSYYLSTANLVGNIPDSKIPDDITPMESVRTREIFAGNSRRAGHSVGQELILSAGESRDKVPNQNNEYVYVNAEQGLSVNTPKVSNWSGGAEGGFNETIITGKAITVGGHLVWHNGNTDSIITTNKLANGAVNGSKIANSAVNGSKIANGSITAVKLASNAVNSDKILNGAVTPAKLNTGAVVTDKIADNTVTEAKLAHVTQGFLLGKGHGENPSAPNLVPIATSITTQSKHNSVPSTKAVKAYVDHEVNQPKGVLYHVNAIQKSRGYFLAGGSNTSNNIYPNNAVLNYAKSILPNLKSGDRVMVTWGYLTTTAQNGTSYAFQYAQTIYLVNSSTSWTAMHHGTVI
jgi:hypothetical protein